MTKNNTRITILGCGSSTGVPRVGNEWGACNPAIIENNRSRCSILIEKINVNDITSVIVDTGPDFRSQVNRANIKKIDAVFYTHEHADHTHGIDDLRMYALRDKKRVDVFASAATSENLKQKFGYCFETKSGSGYPPILNLNIIEYGKTYNIEGEGGNLGIMPINQVHGNINSFGYKVDNIVYSSDISEIPYESIQYIKNCKIWIVDALRWQPHPTHFHVDKVLELVTDLNVESAILTNMHIDLDYKQLCEYLPKNIVPAYDGMII